MSAGGGTAPYDYAITAGALPAGLTLSSGGALSGTPTAGGSFMFTVTATDSSTGSGPYAGSRAYALTIGSATLTMSPSALSDGTAGTAYDAALLAGGGTAPYTYTITSGTPPTALTLSAGGVLSGTPTVAGTFTFTVAATDSSTGGGPYNVSRIVTIVIAPAPPAATGGGTAPVVDAPPPPVVVAPAIDAPLPAPMAPAGMDASRTQLVVDKQGVALSLVCGAQACTISVRGTVALAGRRLGTLEAQQKALKVAAGGRRQLTLRTTVALRRKIRAALAGHAKGRVTITLTATFTVVGGARVTKIITIAVRRLAH